MPNGLQHEVTSLELSLTDYVGSAYSPQVEVEDIDGGHNVSITHKGPDGLVTDSFDVMDGVSPTVNITSTTQLHTITITDAQGPHVYEVDTYADDELARVTAENGRASAESARVSAESARADAETGRSTAESARDDAESARSAAEATRAENEGTRVTNETARVNAESARAEAEQAREQAETSREAAWDALSTQAMYVTQAASSAAQTASQAASAAYSAAQSASQAESTMTANETARVSAEQGRVAAEQGRATAEQNRATAETTRATEWAEIESDAQSAIIAAESATSDATAAAAEARAASAATWLSGNVLFGELEEAAVLTTDDAYSAPPKFLSVYGKSTQDGTPTPSVPVPILSVDDLTLHVCGFNIWDEEWEVGGYNGTTGAKYSSNDRIRSKNAVSILSNTAYYFKCPKNFNLYYYDAIGSFVSTEAYSSTGGIGNSFTTPANARYMRFATQPTYGTTYNHDICINVSDASSNGTYAQYQGAFVSIPLSNNYARSLPDGTRDTLTLSYLRPSTEHEGWGVFGAELVQVVASAKLADLTWSRRTGGSSGSYTHALFQASLGNYSWSINGAICNALVGAGAMEEASFANNHDSGEFSRTTNRSNVISVSMDSITTVADFVAWLESADVELIYVLETSQTHDLGTVELPILPNPLTAWADGGSAQPTISIEYERALSIVIPRIEAAISDLATS